MAARAVGRGHHAAVDLRWVSCPVFPEPALRAATVSVRIGDGSPRAPAAAVLHGPADVLVHLDGSPLSPADQAARTRAPAASPAACSAHGRAGAPDKPLNHPGRSRA